MKVLQICSYYIGNKLYKKLFLEFSKDSLSQNVYIPIKNKELINRNVLDGKGITFHYDFILKKHDRFLYKGKIKKQKARIEEKIVDLATQKVIHAHTLFSDGGTAYLLKKKYGINYIIGVRNTDINTFYKYAIHHRSFSHKVLINASAVVFISHAYKEKTYELLPDKIVSQIESKTYVIPNGIDDKWFTTKIPSKERTVNKKLRLLFTGSLDQNKNLITVLKLVEKLEYEGKKPVLNVAGDGSLKDELVARTIQMGIQERVNYHGNVPTDSLISLADQSDIFILPSYKETFGISYIEAMSRGVPVIYTKNEGIDGYFPEGRVGYSTYPDDVDEMKENIDKIINNYEQISKNCIKESKRFNWKDISNIYIDLYEQIKNQEAKI